MKKWPGLAHLNKDKIKKRDQEWILFKKVQSKIPI